MGIFEAFRAVLRGGIPINFMAGKREICELIGYDMKEFILENKPVKKVRLFLSFADKLKETQTGYWFNPEDFDPALPSVPGDGRIPWSELGSTVILCFKSSDGKSSWGEGAIAEYQRRIRTLNEERLSLVRDSLTLIRAIEHFKDPEARKEEAFEGAEMLSAIDRIVKAVPESGMDKEMFEKIRKMEKGWVVD